MKKFIVFLVIVMIPFGISAQSWLNRAANSSRQHSQRIVPRNNQQTRQNQYDYQRQVQQNRDTRNSQQRISNQQQRSEPFSNETRTTTTNNISSPNDKVVTLVTSGTGSTKEEATRNALRNAIEQAFGTFVSANTQVLNDELIKDEITTVSTGNVKSYKELSVNQTNGMYDVSVQAIVSIDQLRKFAQSKGMRAELAGASFAMNMKIRELNKKNEVNAIDHMIEKAEAIAKNGLFDYKLEIGEPFLTKNSKYAIKLRVLFCENANTLAFYKTIDQTLRALNLSQKEQQEYRNAGLKFYRYNAQLDEISYGNYALRNQYPVFWRSNSITRLLPIVVENALNYEINDNLGNQYYCMRRTIKPTQSVSPLLDYINKSGNYVAKGNDHNDYCVWYWLDKEKQTLWFYELRPQNRIALVNHGEDKYPAIPLMDFTGRYGMGYNGIGTDVSFNPTVDQKGNEKRVNNPQRIYYYQEFFVLYSEEELSKLNSITINHK